MTTLIPASIAQYAYGAGFRGEGLVRAVAVALAESGGRTDAVGVNSDSWRSKDRGLWQINSHWHPEVSNAQAFNPSSAAAAAYRISNKGTNWSPWSTWKNGAAAAQMGRARLGVAQLGPKGYGGTTSSTTQTVAGTSQTADLGGLGDGIGNALIDPLGLWRGLGVSNPVDAFKEATLLAVKTGAWVSNPHNWFRVALVIGGTGGMLLGLALLAKSGAMGDAAKTAAGLPRKAAGAAVTVGAAVGTGGASLGAKAAATGAKAAAATKSATK